MTNPRVRRSGRISREVPIILIGSDAERMVFSEETKTVVLSRHGAGIVSLHKLIAEQELHLRSLESNRETEVRVVGEIGAQGLAHTYGVAFTDPNVDFWKIEFPPAPATETPSLALTLACCGCGADVSLDYGDYEADVCAIHGGLVRYCTECGLSTMWRRFSPGIEAPAAVFAKLKPKKATAAVTVLDLPASDPAPPDSATQDALANRRDRVRAKVNFFAAIRTDAFGEDIVRCIDMSRGGLSFKSNHAYREGAIVRIAVPFSLEAPGAPAIFVPAKVMYTRRIPSQDLYRCGVAYMPAGAL